MSQRMKMVTMWWDEDQLGQLRALAALETLRTGRRVSFSSLVRATVYEHLLKAHPGLSTITNMNAEKQ